MFLYSKERLSELKMVNSNYFQFFLIFLFSLSLYWNLELGINVMTHVTVTVTGSYDMKKDVKESRTNDII